LNQSAAVSTALRFYVHTKDITERTPGKRRMPVTGGDGRRGIAAEVKREILRRAGRKCRLPFCDNDWFLDATHEFEEHADGGCQELWNMDLHCKPHHRMQGRGEWRNVGSTERPVCVDDRGVRIDRRRAHRTATNLATGPPPSRVEGPLAEGQARVGQGARGPEVDQDQTTSGESGVSTPAA
jgi:hypothetical protein